MSTTTPALTGEEINERNRLFAEYKANGGDPHRVPENLAATAARVANSGVGEILDQPPARDDLAESLVVGAMILDPELVDTPELHEGHFALETARVAFRELREMRRLGEPIVIRSVCKRLSEFPEVYGGGTAEFIQSAYDGASAVRSRLPEFIKRLTNAEIERSLDDVAVSILKGTRTRHLSTSELLAQARTAIEILSEGQYDAGHPTIVSAGELIDANPTLREPVVGGILRRGETANIIAPPKVGKSWLAYGLALSKVMGLDWLGRFPCEPGCVLLIDNELHPDTVANRIRTVADAMGIAPSQYRDNLRILSLRGRLLDLNGIDRELRRVESGEYALTILDAFYRAMPAGVSENDNAGMARLFNTIDGTTRRLDCGWLNIHHSSKGNQADKSVTDVGAGAGAQSRAADAHLILRPHEEADGIVLDGVVRSFAPIEPVSLRWQFPLWSVDDSLDPSQVRGRLTKNEEKRVDRDKSDKDKILAALLTEPKTVRQIRALLGGAGKDRANRLLDALEESDAVTWEAEKTKGGQGRVYRINERGTEGGTERGTN